MATHVFKTDDEIRDLAAAFERGALDPANFGHAQHIAVALALLSTAPLPEASDRMRRGLRALVARVNPGAYHETLTIFWMKLLHHLATERHAAVPLWTRVNAIIASFGTSRPIRAHYSSELIASDESRSRWIEPDLVSLPF